MSGPGTEAALAALDQKARVGWAKAYTAEETLSTHREASAFLLFLAVVRVPPLDNVPWPQGTDLGWRRGEALAYRVLGSRFTAAHEAALYCRVLYSLAETPQDLRAELDDIARQAVSVEEASKLIAEELG